MTVAPSWIKSLHLNLSTGFDLSPSCTQGSHELPGMSQWTALPE